MEECLDQLFDRLDDLLLSSRFEECDRVLEEIDINQSPTNYLLVALTATASAKHLLESRAKFFSEVKEEIKSRAEHYEVLLKGLE